MSDELELGQKVPNKSEEKVVGKPTIRISRNSKSFNTLVTNNDDDVKFKDEEHTGADMVMNHRTLVSLNRLAGLVKKEWNGVKVRVTEAWDENGEHKPNSTHYEGRGVDLTTFPKDQNKLGRLGQLAVEAGFDWVWYEKSGLNIEIQHIHASNARDVRGNWKSSQKVENNPRWELRVRGVNCVWQEWNKNGVKLTIKSSVEELVAGRYKIVRDNDKSTLLFLGASEKTANQILDLNPPESYMEINRLSGGYNKFTVKWVGLSWRLHANGNVKDIRMLSSGKEFSLV